MKMWEQTSENISSPVMPWGQHDKNTWNAILSCSDFSWQFVAIIFIFKLTGATDV